MNVSFIDLRARYEDEKVEINQCINRVLESGQLVLGRALDELEEEVCDFTGAKYCVGLNSGTDAIMIALWANQIGKGDEVIIPTISFFATVGAVVHVGATPIFCDVRADLNIDPTQITKLITKKTKAIMPVHWTGRTAEMNTINRIAEENNLLVIEDAAQSMGAVHQGVHPGNFGIASAISCHPLKNFNAIGDAGLLLTSNKDIYDNARKYRNHGMAQRDNAEIFGVNSRLDSVNAEILKYRLKKLPDVISKRNFNVSMYRSLLNIDEISLPPETLAEDTDAYVMFIIRGRDRDGLKAYLDSRGIETLVYYGTPLHKHPATIDLEQPNEKFEKAEQYCSEVLALPHNQYILPEQIEFVCREIKTFYSNSKG